MARYKSDWFKIGKTLLLVNPETRKYHILTIESDGDADVALSMQDVHHHLVYEYTTGMKTFSYYVYNILRWINSCTEMPQLDVCEDAVDRMVKEKFADDVPKRIDSIYYYDTLTFLRIAITNQRNKLALKLNSLTKHNQYGQSKGEESRKEKGGA